MLEDFQTRYKSLLDVHVRVQLIRYSVYGSALSKQLISFQQQRQKRESL